MTRNLLIASALLLGIMSTPSLADTLENFTYTGLKSGGLVNASNDGGVTSGIGDAGVGAGVLGSQDINVFCVDFDRDINDGQSYTADVSYNVTDAAGAQSGNYFAGGLASALNAPDSNNTTGNYIQNTPSSVTSQQRADEVAYLVHTYDNAGNGAFGNDGKTLGTNMAAVQLSIWDIETDGGDGLSKGLFLGQDSTTVTTYGSLVNTLETQAADHENDQYLDVKWIQSPYGANPADPTTYQSFAYCLPVPEASTVAIFAIMLAGGLLCLRTAKKQQTA